ncbi:50S ribosomal protein L20 [Morella rubra]|uniref:Large ribosomal subunit protein bL20c n=1 Tax=Morella rubra TaxID=262757 RepID=A0A6A1W768_9ROSI|nr:50S ribosomal protein L20 [Morella rubra]
MNKDKIFKLAKGFRGRAKNCIRIARERVEKALQYSYRDRRNKKRDMRSLWIQRINAGTRQHGINRPELRHIAHNNNAGVEVDYASDVGGEKIGQVDSHIIEGLVKGLTDRVRDLVLDEVRVESVEVEAQVREGHGDNAAEVFGVAVGGDEVEHYVLWARRVLEDRGHPRYRALHVGFVPGHGDVDNRFG